MERLDERLDGWVANWEGRACFDLDPADGTGGSLEKAFFRALDGDTFKFYVEWRD